MTSILDIYDSMPEHEKEIIDEEILFKIKENWKARYIIDKLLPEKWWRYYSRQFSIGWSSSNEGTFVGLACRSCDAWIEYGHQSNCPMNEIMDGFDYKAAGAFIKEIIAMDRPPVKV